MNREEHLRQNLPRWLELPKIAEVLVVDWSNRLMLGDLRLIDSRIKVVRVEDEPRWILSYAYNVGIARATQPTILKCDSDCLPEPEVTDLIPGNGHFFAGNWKSGALVDKRSVNGQCIFSKAQFEAVNGYSELIRTYGRDDEDFYARLASAGFERREISPDLLEFIEHSDGERTVNQFAASQTLSEEQAVLRHPLYNEMHNAFVAQRMPWGPGCASAPFEEVRSEERLTILRRNHAAELRIPDEMKRAAHLFALRYVATQIGGLPQRFTDRLDERGCMTLIASRTKGRSRDEQSRTIAGRA